MILAPVIVPGIAVALGLHSVFIQLGLTNTLAGVMLVHLVPTLPYMTLVMAGIFANYDPAFEQQARSLGASPLQTFRHVTLPGDPARHHRRRAVRVSGFVEPVRPDAADRRRTGASRCRFCCSTSPALGAQ